MVSVTHRVNVWVGRSQYTENWPWAPESHRPCFMESLLIPFIKKKKVTNLGTWTMGQAAHATQSPRSVVSTVTRVRQYNCFCCVNVPGCDTHVLSGRGW